MRQRPLCRVFHTLANWLLLNPRFALLHVGLKIYRPLRGLFVDLLRSSLMAVCGEDLFRVGGSDVSVRVHFENYDALGRRVEMKRSCAKTQIPAGSIS